MRKLASTGQLERLCLLSLLRKLHPAASVLHTLFNADYSEPVEIIIQKQCEAFYLLERISIRTVLSVKKASNLPQRELMMVFQDLHMERPTK